MAYRSRLYVGTSGWNYPDWREEFYPPGLKARDYLGYYARHFRTVEVNYSFYHQPTPRTYRHWAAQVPDDFVFALKASRFITHIRRLRDAGDAWRRFVDNALELGERLGPVLLQLPPSLRPDPGVLEAFLEEHAQLEGGRKIRLALEFRHAGWFEEKVYALLRVHGAALVRGHSQRYPLAPPEETADFIYLRFHGPGRLFASSYTDEALAEWAARIRQSLKRRNAAFAYFNNDFQGFALRNARTLLQMV